MLELTKKTFEKTIKNSTPALVEFWAAWCGPCKIMSPIFEELSKEYTKKITFAKVNVDEESSIAETYNVMGIPCMILFRNGEEITRFVGAMSKESLKQQLNHALASA